MVNYDRRGSLTITFVVIGNFILRKAYGDILWKSDGANDFLWVAQLTKRSEKVAKLKTWFECLRQNRLRYRALMDKVLVSKQ